MAGCHYAPYDRFLWRTDSIWGYIYYCKIKVINSYITKKRSNSHKVCGKPWKNVEKSILFEILMRFRRKTCAANVL